MARVLRSDNRIGELIQRGIQLAINTKLRERALDLQEESAEALENYRNAGLDLEVARILATNVAPDTPLNDPAARGVMSALQSFQNRIGSGVELENSGIVLNPTTAQDRLKESIANLTQQMIDEAPPEVKQKVTLGFTFGQAAGEAAAGQAQEQAGLITRRALEEFDMDDARVMAAVARHNLGIIEVPGLGGITFDSPTAAQVFFGLQRLGSEDPLSIGNLSSSIQKHLEDAGNKFPRHKIASFLRIYDSFGKEGGPKTRAEYEAKVKEVVGEEIGGKLIQYMDVGLQTADAAYTWMLNSTDTGRGLLSLFGMVKNVISMFPAEDREGLLEAFSEVAIEEFNVPVGYTRRTILGQDIRRGDFFKNNRVSLSDDGAGLSVGGQKVPGSPPQTQNKVGLQRFNFAVQGFESGSLASTPGRISKILQDEFGLELSAEQLQELTEAYNKGLAGRNE